MNNCTISANTADNGGGSYYGTINNSTISGNSADWYGGGSYQSTLNHCTVSGNSAASSGGGAHYGTINNCIVYYNSASDHPNYNAGTYRTSCTTPHPGGTGNITQDPQLLNTSHIATNSPCIGAGTTAYTSGTDIDGEGWKTPPSMGCDEIYSGSFTGALEVAIIAEYTNAIIHHVVQFEVAINGKPSMMVWSLGDGTVRTNTIYVSHTWTSAGEYPVILNAFNETYPGGIAATVVVHVVTGYTNYVSLSGNHTYPYTTWQTAATNIQDAVDAVNHLVGDDAVVLVTNGVYHRGATITPGYSLSNRVVITKEITVQSVNGPEVTVIQGQGPLGDQAIRCVYMSAGILSGFTLTHGYTQNSGDYTYDQSGGGVHAKDGGILINCIITGNHANWSGGGIYGGTINDCTLSSNSAGSSGGGSHDGTLYNCRMIGNSGVWGGGASENTLYNCVLSDNSGSFGGGAYYATLYNCTLSGNSASFGSGAFYGSLTNCIAYYNLGSVNDDTYQSVLSYSCSTDHTENGNITNMPLFVDADAGNYQLQSDSPCIDSGTNLLAIYPPEAMFDLDGRPRWIGEQIDMGAYESTYGLMPWIDITHSDAIVTDDLTSYDIAGTNNVHVVGTMTWTNAGSGAFGTLAASGQWQVTGIPLDFHGNLITVTGTNIYGDKASDHVTITREFPVEWLPLIAITNWNANISYGETSATIRGTNKMIFGDMGWIDDYEATNWFNRSGDEWSVTVTGLEEGANVITVVGTNHYNYWTNDTVTITRETVADVSPFIDITNAPPNIGVGQTTATISGTNFLIVGNLGWVDDHEATNWFSRSGNEWSVTVTGLEEGANVITIVGTNIYGHWKSDRVTITRFIDAEVEAYWIVKIKSFEQTGTNLPLLSIDSPFHFGTYLDAPPPISVSGAAVIPPGALPVHLMTDGPGSWDYESSFQAFVDLQTAFPDGVYTMNVDSANSESLTADLHLSGDFPPAPHITNVDEAKHVPPGQDFTIHWDAWHTTNSNSFITVFVDDYDEEEVYEAEFFSISGTSTSAIIPGAVLKSGLPYYVGLGFVDVSDSDGKGSAVLLSETYFELMTTGTPELDTKLQFKLGREDGTFVGGPTGVISGIMHVPPNPWYRLRFDVVDSHFPESVLFTGPPGSGLENYTSGYSDTPSDVERRYYTFSQTIDPGNYPHAGTYTVQYNTQEVEVVVADDIGSRQLLPIPTMIVNESGILEEIRWQYTDLDGNPVTDFSFIERVDIEISRHFFEPSIYSGSLGGYSSSHTLGSTVYWKDVGRISIHYTDDLGNEYLGGFRKLDEFGLHYQFEHVDGSMVPETNGTFKGRINIPPRTQYNMFFTAWDTNYMPQYSVNITGPEGARGILFSRIGEGEKVYYSSYSDFAFPPNNPPGGTYTVNAYNGRSWEFDMLNPDTLNRQLIPVPTITTNTLGIVRRIDWTWQTSLGVPVENPDFIHEISVYFEGEDDFDLHYLPGTITNHTIDEAFYWSDVSYVKFEWVDTLGNRYVSRFLTEEYDMSPHGQPDLMGLNGNPASSDWFFDVSDDQPFWGDLIGLTFGVLNHAQAYAEPFHIRLYLSPDPIIDPTDYPLAYIPVANGLRSDDYFGFSDYSYPIQLPAADPFGYTQPTDPATYTPGTTNYTIGMLIDYENVVVEDNEANNSDVGVGIDQQPLEFWIIRPPVRVNLSDQPSTNWALNFYGVPDDGPGGHSEEKVIRVVNTGDVPVTVSQNGITLATGLHFKVSQILSTVQGFIDLSSAPHVIAPNNAEQWQINLVFDPVLTGSLEDQWSIAVEDPTNAVHTVDLMGSGDPVPDILVLDPVGANDDSSMYMGRVAADGVSGAFIAQTIELLNVGSGTLTIDPNGLFFNSGTHFEIDSIHSSTQGNIDLTSGSATLAPRQSEIWTVNLRFDPTTTGQSADLLTIQSDSYDEETVQFAVTGRGVTLPDIVAVDSVGPEQDLNIDFTAVHADGTHRAFASATVTLFNLGEGDLHIPSNGIYIVSNAAFIVHSISNNADRVIDGSQPVVLVGSSQEVWNVALRFDPTMSGIHTGALCVLSDDPDESSLIISLSGTGLDEPDITVEDTVSPLNDYAILFGSLLNDGVGERLADQQIIIRNIGTQPLMVAQNGIGLGLSNDYSISGIVSSVSGPVDLSTGPDAIESLGAETWTVDLILDPTSNGEVTNRLDITSNDSDEPLVSIALNGEGVQPQLILRSPSSPMGIPAGKAYPLRWTDEYPAGNAQISLFLDTDTNPANGLVPIASNLSEDSDQDLYYWVPATGLVDQVVYVYGRISDASITNTMYAPGTLNIEEVHSFQLLSPTETTDQNYTYQYRYNGVLYSDQTPLTKGENVIVVTNLDDQGSSIQHEFRVTLVDSLADQNTYTYNELGYFTTLTNARGIVTTYLYDKLDRLIRIETSGGSVVDYDYDVLRRVTHMADDTGWTFYTYDDLDRLIAIARSENAVQGDTDDVTIQYEYDLASQRMAMIYPSGTRIEYRYDPAGRLLAVSNAVVGEATTYEYNATHGLLSAVTRPNGVRTKYTFDHSARLTDVRHEKASTEELISLYHYELDPGGRRTELHVMFPATPVQKEKYSYDAFDQLIEVVYSDDATFEPTDKTVRYTYSPNGNRLTRTLNEEGGAPEEVHTYVYGNENRPLEITDQIGATIAEYDYDAAGNRITKITPTDTTHYIYDDYNRLTRVVNSTHHIEYAYDGAGHRLSKSINGIQTQYIVDPALWIDQVIEEHNETGDLTARYTYGLQRISGQLPGESEEVYYLSDGLNSTRQLTDQNGTTTASYSYDAFGVAEASIASANEYLFTGERLETETGLIYLRARYVDPAIGRFISKDPLGISAGLNAYIYVENDPINKIDPAGTLSLLASLGQLWLQTSVYWDAFIKSRSGAYAMHTIYAGYTALKPAYMPSAPDIDALPSLKMTRMGVSLAKKHHHKVPHIFGKVIDWVDDTAANGLRQLGELITPDVPLAPNPWQWNPAFGPETPEQRNHREGQDIVNTFTAYGQMVRDWWKGLSANSGPTGGNHGGAGGSGNGRFTSGGIGSDSPFTPPVGGVLIDKAAELIGTDLSDIVGATYDPISQQMILLGNEETAIPDINMDYFFTAIQAVYGSVLPPFVTIDPPAFVVAAEDLNDGDDVFEQGESGVILIDYHPLWEDPDDDMQLQVRMSWGWSNHQVTAHIDARENTNIIAGTRHLMELVITNWTGLPDGITVEQFTALTNVFDAHDQYSSYLLRMHNDSGQDFIVDQPRIVPNLQHRKYGGRVDDTRLGWVMYEADRMMKSLTIGVDNLTGASYSSANVDVPGYSNLVERFTAARASANSLERFWFVPNEMTLKRYVDTETGQATIVFDQATVLLQTETMLNGGSVSEEDIPPQFAAHFNAQYDAFADLTWPVMDPDDPTGENIIEVKIFEQLREVMQAVSLARFFRDNNIPLDMWWLNSWEPPHAWSRKTIPTTYRSTTNGNISILIYGGAIIDKANTYQFSALANDVGQETLAQRTDLDGDLDAQSWDVTGSSTGDLRAVALSMDKQYQDGNSKLAFTDIRFASPGLLDLSCQRFYDSAYVGRGPLGPGWRSVRYGLEFSRPSWVDEHRLMVSLEPSLLPPFFTSVPVWSDEKYNTHLRSGEIRFVDYATGRTLNFYSSLTLPSNMDPSTIMVSGLDSNGVPRFTPGEWQNGSTLIQQPDESKAYVLRSPDGTTITFDHEGYLLTLSDADGHTLTHTYFEGRLTNIVDAAGQSLCYRYTTNKQLDNVIGPAAEEIRYSYDAQDRLTEVLHVRSTASTTYLYNQNNQLVSMIQFDESTHFTNTLDLRGRCVQREDRRGNLSKYNFEINAATLQRTSQIQDPVSGATWRSEYDAHNRLILTEDALGNQTRYEYLDDSRYPNTVRLPIPDRASIRIQRNGYGFPTNVMDPENSGALPITIAYNEANQPVRTTDAAGREQLFSYDANHHLTDSTAMLGTQAVRVAFGYQEGYLQTITDPLNHVLTYAYDTVGRVTNVIDATGIQVGFEYDELGRLVKIYDPRYATPISFTYNDFDAITSITTPAGTVLYQYDLVTHRLISVIDMNGNITRYVYDPGTGDLIETLRENPTGPTENVSFSYDRFGNIEKIIDPEGWALRFIYDDLGRLVSEWDTGIPFIAVTTMPQTISYDVSSFDVRGICHPDLMQISWTNQRNESSGIASSFVPGETRWTTPNIPLSVGHNLIVVSGTNSGGHTADDSVTIIRQTRLLGETYWWYRRKVLADEEDGDYAAVNVGQLKWVATQARQEFEEKLSSGAGSNVVALVNGFVNSNNYLTVNLGQLKTVAQPFYDRLWELGLTHAYPEGVSTQYPWQMSTHATNDYNAANIGQLKYLFSFELQ